MATITNRALRLVGHLNARPAEVHHFPIDTTGITIGGSTDVAAGIGRGSLVVRIVADGRVAAPLATALINEDTDDRLDFEDHSEIVPSTTAPDYFEGIPTAEPPVLGIALKSSLGMAEDDLMPVAILTHGAILEGNLMDGIGQGTNALNDLDPGFWGFTVCTGALTSLVGTIYKSPLGVTGNDATGGGIGDTNALVQVVWSPSVQLTMF